MGHKIFFCMFVFLAVSCLHKVDVENSVDKPARVIQCAGSDTIVNVSQAWAEKYREIEKNISVEVSGGGSGTGIAGLMNGTLDIANSSRKITHEEFEKIVKERGKEPVEHIVGYDALAVFVNKNNPIEEISLEELAEIYGENGTIERWSQLGINMPVPDRDKIIVTSRQSNSGTYFYFREVVVGKKRDFRLGTIDLHGSKEVVELVGRTINAIGYTGMGYARDEVKMLRISKKRGEKSIAASIDSVLDHSYPIARPLFIYTCGEPPDYVQKFIDWIYAEEAQDLLMKSGFVPVKLGKITNVVKDKIEKR